MALAPGARLGSYELLDLLGEGGMGAVYRARDPRLGREVAIKVVLEAFVADRERLARFEREARALAAINHPNIATLHGIDVDAAEGRHFLVMELVDGRTLAETISAGPVPLPSAINIATQIAEALEAAHEKGIVHRDLKPANVKITPDDKVKVLDFGLAKSADAGERAGSFSASVANSPTLTAMGTQAGMILGTASYMSPEQARGMSGDHRSDVFSFGVVLYELLTGRQPFQGETVSDVLASVLAREPELGALPDDLSPRLKELVARCLEKQPKRRWQAMGDVRHELEVIAKNPRRVSDPAITGSSAPVASARPLAWRNALMTVGALAIGAVATAAAFMTSRPAPPPTEPVTFEVLPPAAAPVMSISPDGRQIVHGTLATDGPTRLWIRSLSSVDVRPIPGTDGALIRRGQWIANIAWSPDSRSIAFAPAFQRAALNRLDLDNGNITELVKLPGQVVIPGGWNDEGTILYGRRNALDATGAGIWRISASGGSPTQVTKLARGDLAHRPSGFLPDGRRFLYVAYQAAGGGEIRIGSIDRQPEDQDETTLLEASGPAVYSPSGHLLYVKGTSLMAQAFDAVRGELASTPPVLLASGVDSQVAVSGNGRLLYRLAGNFDARPQSEIVRLNRQGSIIGRFGPPANYNDVNALAKGAGLAVSRAQGSEISGHLYIVDARGAFTRLNPGSSANYAAAVAPDNLIAYTFSPEDESRDIYVRPASGVGEPRLLVANTNLKHPNSWTPDGRFLIYDEHVPARQQDLMMVRRDGGTPVALLATEWDETFAMVSPDGKWLAYRSTESGQPEVYLRDFDPDRTPALGAIRVKVSIDRGDKPRWHPNGRELFFLQEDSVMAVSIDFTGPTPKPGVPVKLFDAQWIGYIPYDVLNDGSFVFNSIVQKPNPPTPLRVVLDWESMIRK